MAGGSLFSGGYPGNMVFTKEDGEGEQPSSIKWILMFVSVSELLQSIQWLLSLKSFATCLITLEKTLGY